MQYAKPKDTSQRLSPSKKKYIQEVIETFLYYGHAVDSIMLTALSTIASVQAKPTEETMTRFKQFLDYAATHQDAILTYKASDMVLSVHSDASYLSELAISSYHPAMMTRQTTGMFSTSHNSSRLSCPLQQKQNLVHSTSTHVRSSPNE